MCDWLAWGGGVRLRIEDLELTLSSSPTIKYNSIRYVLSCRVNKSLA